MDMMVPASPAQPFPGLRVAIVHEWLTQYAGSERVLEQMLALFPEADLFAVVDFLPAHERGFLDGRPVRTTFLQKLPFGRRVFRLLLGLMPFAVEQFDLCPYDLVLSSSHAVAKGVLTGPDQTHVSYVHSPIRYAWDMQHQYLRQTGLDRGLRGLLARLTLARLRAWDVRTANGVDHFVANSNHIARRIRKTYRRDAAVVPPPVDTARFVPAMRRTDTFLTASRLVPYKRVDLVVRAFRDMPDRPLIVVGDGSERDAVRRAAAGAPNIRFLGTVPQGELVRLMGEARAFVSAAEEDFGIAMAEVQSCGTPLIAFERGGIRDILGGGDGEAPTGVLFARQTPDAIRDAVRRFDRVAGRFTAENCRRNALRFGEEAFRARLLDEIGTALAARPDRSRARRFAALAGER